MIKNLQEIISQLKSQVPINELISDFVQVKKSGRNYVCVCPFHDDHHPSLQINVQKGIFKCFACGTGGDLITFHSLFNKKKWAESIQELAEKYGIKVEYSSAPETKAENEIKNQLLELNSAALEYFKYNLTKKDDPTALHYLQNKRKLTSETISKYELGYALNSWDSLLNYLTKEKKYVKELIIASGLFIPRENDNGYYDRFRNRVIFPIFNESNSVIGFGGRTLSGDDVKYINSPETLVFSKGNNLYGLNFAKNAIRESNYSILTEGYLDVISAHQHGLLNTVATLGTALTQQQARLLTKYTASKQIYLCLDSDNAGKKAVENIFRHVNEISQSITLDIRVTTTLGAKDLDDSLNTFGYEDVKRKIKESIRLTEFIFEQYSGEYLDAQKNKNEVLKKDVLEKILEILYLIKDPIEGNEYIKLISHKLSIDEELLNLKLKDKQRSTRQKNPQYSKKTAIFKDDDEYKMLTNERFKHAEIELLTLYISSFPSCQEIKNDLADINLIDDKHKLIKEFLDTISLENFSCTETINKLFIEFNEYKHIMSTITDIAWRLENDESLSESYSKNKSTIINQAKEWINWWITNKQKIKELTSKLKDSTSKEEGNELLTQMLEVVRNKSNQENKNQQGNSK